MWLGLAVVTYAVVHPVAQVGWTMWTVHWSTVIGLTALGGAYVWGARHLGARARLAGTEPPRAAAGASSSHSSRACW